MDSKDQRLSLDNIEEVAGGSYSSYRSYNVGAHVVCFRGIKWEVVKVFTISTTGDTSYNCKAVIIPQDWQEWISPGQTRCLDAGSIVDTW